MPWLKFSDDFTENPKVAPLDPVELAFYVAGIVYCGRNLTDGFIPGRIAYRLQDLEGIGHIDPGHDPSDATYAEPYVGGQVADRLVYCKLWEEVPGGYQVHDYLDYNPSKASVLAERSAKHDAKSAAGKKGAEARWGNKGDGTPMAEEWQDDDSGIADAGADLYQTDGPVPVPVPEAVPEPQEVQELKTLAPFGANVDNPVKSNSGQVPDRWPYFLDKLSTSDPRWLKVTLGALRNLAKQSDEEAVTTALGFASEAPPDIRESSPMGWLTTTVRSVYGARVSA